MIIRSQDKKAIVNLNNLDTVSIDSKNAIDVYSGEISTRCTIANYSTEEKAIKVLDMIVNSYVESMWTDEKMIIANNVCFEMPQDSEV